MLVVAAAGGVAAGSDAVWTFDRDAAGKPPAGLTFRVARDAAPSLWVVQREGANGFLTHVGEPAGRGGFALAILDATARGATSASARTRLAGSAGTVGLAWRIQDGDNYYLARLDLQGDEQDVGFYRIVNGNRSRVDGEDDLEIDPAAWHTLKIVQQDDQIRVYLGGIRVLSVRDRTFARPGAVGLWCTGDAVAHFDDVRVDERRGDR